MSSAAPPMSFDDPRRLLAPVTIGTLDLPSRVVMAPMTRTRADAAAGIPGPLIAEYYRQRATAGLIVSECTHVSLLGRGIVRSPGLHTAEQTAGWRLVADAVHGAGGRIFAQLWHCGRIAHPALLGGQTPVAPSPVAASGTIYTADGMLPYPVPRELDVGEIAAIVEEFRDAAANARAAGLDGVELHGAFGYLVDQFLQDGTNRRTDAYGGSPEARTRFLREVTQALVDVWGADPDLPRCLAGGGPFNAPDPSTFYGEGPGGYTDYPALGVS